ncbi:MAG TPA: hypothetical protein VG650_11010 [Mycobacteriales bacterium]|nr:hypothetical protein [Mycobacteriales bacterium]
MTEPESVPLLPDTTADEREIGWGDDLDDDTRDEDLNADRPPHYEDRD